MKKLFNIILLILSLCSGYCGYYYASGKISYALFLLCGFIIGICIMQLKLDLKNDKINSYKKELEKESVFSDESNARVKVLESKIEVLEKALESALKK